MVEGARLQRAGCVIRETEVRKGSSRAERVSTREVIYTKQWEQVSRPIVHIARPSRENATYCVVKNMQVSQGRSKQDVKMQIMFPFFHIER